MASLSTVVFLSAFAAMAVAVIPNDYILEVTPLCGTDARGDATIQIVTDLQIIAQAECNGNVAVNFTSTDDVNFFLPVSYPRGGSQTCVFRKKSNSLVFSVKVVVAYGEDGSFVHMDEEEYTVTCTFSPRGSDFSPEQNIVEGLIAPPELQTNVGPTSKSTFTLELVNVLGKPFRNKTIHLGRTVQLKGETGGEDGEAGIRPVSCVAIDGGARYAILRAGCGDGIVFPKDFGFSTKGKITMSPYFQAFSVNFNPVIKFECNFVTCKSSCDGSSCKNERRKRDTTGFPKPPLQVTRRTEILRFEGEVSPNLLAQLIRRR